LLASNPIGWATLAVDEGTRLIPGTGGRSATELAAYTGGGLASNAYNAATGGRTPEERAAARLVREAPDLTGGMQAGAEQSRDALEAAVRSNPAVQRRVLMQEGARRALTDKQRQDIIQYGDRDQVFLLATDDEVVKRMSNDERKRIAEIEPERFGMDEEQHAFFQGEYNKTLQRVMRDARGR
jgi:hypothetical protein